MEPDSGSRACALIRVGTGAVGSWASAVRSDEGWAHTLPAPSPSPRWLCAVRPALRFSPVNDSRRRQRQLRSLVPQSRPVPRPRGAAGQEQDRANMAGGHSPIGGPGPVRGQRGWRCVMSGNYCPAPQTASALKTCSRRTVFFLDFRPLI